MDINARDELLQGYQFMFMVLADVWGYNTSFDKFAYSHMYEEGSWFSGAALEPLAGEWL